MPFLAQNIIGLLLAMAAVVTAGTVLLIAIAVGRRRQRERHFKRLDALRHDYGPIVTAVVAGDMDYLRGLSFLDQLQGRDRDSMLERLCLEQNPTPEQVPVLRRLCEDLGLVRLWQRDLVGNHGWESLRDSLRRTGGLLRHIDELGFLVRAKSAENLRLIRHEASWPLLVRALDDLHGDVKRGAVRALGSLAVPESFPALVGQLQAIVLEPRTRLSFRTVKAAMVGFPLAQAVDLLPSLNHKHPRIRFLATDIIREMVERRAALERDFVLSERVFPRKVAEAFLFRLAFDVSADVRGRAAPVIAFLPENMQRGIAPRTEDSRPSQTLLTMLNDPQWFVRLQAVRALGKRRYAPQAPRMAHRLTDPDWRVREAAAQALVAVGQEGVDQLLEYLVDTHDRYSQEQIIEALEQAGLIPALLTEYARGAGIREGRILETFVNLGKTCYLERVLQNGASPAVRSRFWTDFRGHPDRRIHAWAKRITGN